MCLRELLGERDGAAIARLLKRPVASVERMADRLFPRDQRTGPWTPREELELRRHYGTCTPERIARMLGRSLDEVSARLAELCRPGRQGPWTAPDLALFKRIYGTRTDEVLARVFGCTPEEIDRLARRHALAKDKAFERRQHGQGSTHMRRWRREEIDILKGAYATRSNLELALGLGRSVKSLVSKAHHLGLKKSFERLRRMGQENVSVRYRSDERATLPY